MAELTIDARPDAVSVEEMIIARLADAATTRGLEGGELAFETINAWRTIRATAEAVAAEHGLTVTEPIGALAADQIIAETAPYLQAEQEATRER